ncbi:PH domain-containing protein [Streptomyces sp. NRRL S-350]|uniref:PH domain-containing protein n=1 Tax=Streptomyces sp. NRRL S-350 TaxID=1463902 RepID=UPI000691DBFE|nr:PH domain-containing protein [Streptomyces sp. NRRL S-350]
MYETNDPPAPATERPEPAPLPFQPNGVVFTPLPRAALRLWRATAVGLAIPVCTVGTATALIVPQVWSHGPSWLVWPVWLGWAVAALGAVRCAVRWWRLRARWEFAGYALTEDRLWVRGGLWHRGLYELAYGRIQTIEVESGPLQRRFGLASVRVTTGAYHQLSVHDVQADDAERIREVLSVVAREHQVAL